MTTQKIFGLTLVGDSQPVPHAALARFPIESDYVQLLTSYGAGRACGFLTFPHPVRDAELLEDLQRRFLLHAHHEQVMGRWSRLTPRVLEEGIVIGTTWSGGAIVSGDGAIWIVGSATPTTVPRLSDMVSRGPMFTYATAPSRRAELVALLSRGAIEEADACLREIADVESTFGLRDVAYDVATGCSEIAADSRSEVFDTALRMTRGIDETLVEHLPIRELRSAIGRGKLTGDHRALLATAFRSPSVFRGDMGEIERGLVDQILADRNDRTPFIALADHLETIGDTDRAAVIREQAEATAGVVVRAGLDAGTLDEWLAVWRTDDPDRAAALEAELATLPRQIQLACASWFATGVYDPQLATTDGAHLVLALALRSRPPYAHTAIVHARATRAAPWILDAIRRPSAYPRSFSTDALEDLALAYLEISKLDKRGIDDALTFVDDSTRRRAGLCLVQAHAKDDRVFLACLEHFADGHPYTEKAIARRRADPRVVPALLAAFEREEKRSLIDGKHVAYTKDYGILARYLAKLGNARGKAAWERYKSKGRIDRAEASRETRREGI